MAIRKSSVPLSDYLKTTNGQLTDPLVMKNNTPIRSELASGGDLSDMVIVGTDSKLKVGTTSLPLTLHSSIGPTVNIAGTEYKLYTEGFPPPSAGPAVGLKGVKVFNANGSYTRPDGVTRIIVEMVGGGGGGAGAKTTTTTAISCGGGGGGGGYFKFLLDVSTVATYPIVIGGGGDGGGGGVAQENGYAGGATSFGGFITTNGGGGGNAVTYTAVPVYGTMVGGLGGAGYLTATAPTGYVPLQARPGDGGGASIMNTNMYFSGKGGNSMLGIGGPIVQNAIGIGGQIYATGNYGAGGSGGSLYGSIGTRKGGPGGPGVVIIWEY